MAAPIWATPLAAGPSRSSRAISEKPPTSPARPARSRAPTRQHPAALGAGFEHRLGHFLDKERHAVGALDDLGDRIPRFWRRLGL